MSRWFKDEGDWPETLGKPEAKALLFSIILAVDAFYLKGRQGTLASCCCDPGDFFERAYSFLAVVSVVFECRHCADAGHGYAEHTWCAQL